MNDATNVDVVTEYERETWSRCAESYIDTFATLTGETVPLLMKAANVGRGTKVLEIGSGPGQVAHALAACGAVATGVDFSSQMVSVAQQMYPDITFQEANAEQLPFEDGTFDAVVSNFAVHHFARPEVVFGEISRVLMSGRRFAFAVWGAPEAQSSIGAFFGAVQAHYTLDELPHGPLFGVTERSVYEPMLTAAGLTDCQLSTHGVVWRSEGLEPILRGFWEWGNIAALPQDVQGRIEATTRENAEAYEQDGRFAFPHSILLGSAV